MNKIEAFKNELRNYKFYKSCLNSMDEDLSIIKSKKKSSEYYNVLKKYNRDLCILLDDIDETFTKMTGLKAVSYEKQPSTFNEQISEQIKLSLIEKYNNQLKQLEVEISKSLKSIADEHLYMTTSIKKIEKTLDKLDGCIKGACISIYCDGKSYEQVANGNNIFWNASGLFYQIEKGLDKAL